MPTPTAAGRDTVVAIVPAKDRADRVAATGTALRGLRRVQRVVVVDDGSTDATGDEARSAGADVLVLPRNRGKAGAVQAGVEHAPEADVFLLIDADLHETAAEADVLLDPVLAGDADMTIGVLPSAGSRGGFGLVKGLAARGIHRASGFEAAAPLSGQRAVRADLLRSLTDVHRFGLEVALTVDARRAGARVVEVPVPMDHRHAGRGPAGFAHRGRQGADIVRALWPRVTSSRQRIAAVAAVGLVVIAGMAWTSAGASPASAGPSAPVDKVVIFGVPGLSLDDLAGGATPNLRHLADEGAVSVNSVRAPSDRPPAAETYATIGAGVTVRAPGEAVDARMADDPVGGGTAAEVLSRQTGRTADGAVVVVGGPKTVAESDADRDSKPGALGQALDSSGRSVAVVGNGDSVNPNGERVINRPAAVAVMNDAYSVDHGDVSGTVGTSGGPDAILMTDPSAPSGIRADPVGVLREVAAAERDADVVVVDPGDTDRAAHDPSAAGDASSRRQALRDTDDLIGSVAGDLPPGTLLLVVSVSPPGDAPALTPMVAYGAGVSKGYIYSPSTRTLGLTTVTDIAPTVLDQLGVDVPSGMIGAPLRYHPGDADLARLASMDEAARLRESRYFDGSFAFILLQAAAYIAVILLLTRGGRPAWISRSLGLAALAFAAWPVATFLERAFPLSIRSGPVGPLLLWIIAFVLALVASLFRSRPLRPLQLVCGATIAVLVADLATGAHLQMSSLLGYSPHAAARYTGIGNTAFAVLGATAIVAGLMHVQYATPARRPEAVMAAGVLFGVVIFADGWPTLGADLGGIVTLVPVLGLCLVAVSGRRVGWRTFALVGAVTVVLLALVIGLDLLRPADQRTHVGTFVADVWNNTGTFQTTVSRKASTNLRVLGGTIWTWMVPVALLLVFYVRFLARSWSRLLPPRSAQRAALLGLLGLGLLGGLVNDSGVVVTALAFVYVGPFLTLLALDDAAGAPQLRPAPPGVPDPGPRSPERAKAGIPRMLGGIPSQEW